MNLHGIHHEIKSNYAFAYTQDSIIVRLRTAKEDMDHAYVIFADKFAWEKRKKQEMKKVFTDELFDYYEAEIFMDSRRFVYIFEVVKGKEVRHYSEAGVMENMDLNHAFSIFFQFPFINENDLHSIPEWAKDGIFYQIFLDRFQRGCDKEISKKLSKWGTKPNGKSFYGGDLEGVIQKLDYLKELGINAIYISPLFTSPSNHKYDTINYFEIDPDFGDKETLKRLVAKAHEMGIKVVLDAVFNHSGWEFPQFQDVVEKGEESPYYDWFYIHDNNITKDNSKYRTFGFVANMPKLNTNNPEVVKYLTEVATYWIKECDIDGWRLDVSDEIDHPFWREFRKAVREVKEDVLIIGEIWFDSIPWLRGDQFDCVMNYPVTRECMGYFALGMSDAKYFTQRLSTILMRNTTQVNEVQLNLLDSHDTPRFLTTCKGNVPHFKNAITFLFTYMGIPCTYYGTEIGLEGEHDPDCRRTFDWSGKTWNDDINEYYKKLIQIRNGEIALRRGQISFGTHPALFVMERYTDQQKVVVLINQTEEPHSFETTCTVELLTGAKVEKGTVVVPAKSSMILK